MYILSQIIVGIADLFFILSVLSKRKINLTILLFFSDILFATHYLILGAFTGSIIIFIDAVFLIVSFLLQKYNQTKYLPLSVYITIGATIITCIFTWAGMISILPLASMLVYLVGMLFNNMVFIKLGTVIRNLLNIVYLIIITSYVGAILEFVLMSCGIIGMIQSNNQNKKSLTT